MEDYFTPQILRFTNEDIEKKIMGRTYEFHLNSDQSGSNGLLITGKVIDFNSTINNELYSLNVLLENNEIEEILIVRIRKMKFSN